MSSALGFLIMCVGQFVAGVTLVGALRKSSRRWVFDGLCLENVEFLEVLGGFRVFSRPKSMQNT